MISPDHLEAESVIFLDYLGVDAVVFLDKGLNEVVRINRPFLEVTRHSDTPVSRIIFSRELYTNILGEVYSPEGHPPIYGEYFETGAFRVTIADGEYFSMYIISDPRSPKSELLNMLQELGIHTTSDLEKPILVELIKTALDQIGHIV